MYITLIALASFVLVYAGISKRLEKTVISGPMLYIAFGFLIGPAGLGLLGLEHISVDTELEALSVLAELTLALVLFAGAGGADLSTLKSTSLLPVRLLGLALPLTIALGFLVGLVLFPGLGLFEIAVIATILAPTDAALGQAVVTNRAVPAHIREGLNVESGLNDGVCVPFLLLFVGLASGAMQVSQSTVGAAAARLVAQEIGIGVLSGILVTLAGSAILRRFRKWGWIARVWAPLPLVALALLAFGVAQQAGGSGFISSFVGGLVFNIRGGEQKDQFLGPASTMGELLQLLTWVFFGALAVGPSLHNVSAAILIYALLSLTIVRMVPVALSVIGLGLDSESKLFIGWFGPRGLATLVFIVMVITADLPGYRTIMYIGTWTVMLSVLLHGLTANPLVALYARTRQPVTAAEGTSTV